MLQPETSAIYEVNLHCALWQLQTYPYLLAQTVRKAHEVLGRDLRRLGAPPGPLRHHCHEDVETFVVFTRKGFA
jgi:hypothetical protein